MSMATATSGSSPSSFQLRWGILRRKSPPVLLSARLRPPKRFRRVGIVRADTDKDTAGADGAEYSGTQPSSVSSPVDKFAGWFGEDYDGEGSLGGGRFGGITGAVLAGIFLAGGIAFALLSLNSRRQSGFKPQMQALTVEQEALIALDYENDKSLVKDKSREETLEDDAPGSKSGINEESTSSPDSIESTSPSRPVENIPEVLSLESKSISSCGATVISHDNEKILTLDSDTSNEFSVADPSNASSLEDVQSQVTSNDVDSEIADSGKISSFVTEPKGIDVNDQGQDAISDDLTQSSSDPSTQFVTEPGIPFVRESNTTLDIQENRENLEAVELGLNGQDIGLGEELWSLNDDYAILQKSEDKTSGSIPSGKKSASDLDQSEEYKLLEGTINYTLKSNLSNDCGFSEAPSSSLYGDPYVNKHGVDQKDETGRSLSTSASPHHKTSFIHAGIPAPSVVSPALQVQLGKVLIPAVVDQVQGQALAALQVLKVIEADVQPGDMCTRREYARWLVSASSALSRSTASKVYPAMYIENVTELAFDDISPDDPDFPSIQGLAEAGLISSKLSCSDTSSLDERHASVYFSPESPLSRQDLVSWKMALGSRVLPEVDEKILHECSGYIDIDKIDSNAWPAIVADITSGENGIISLAFGYTRLFQPDKPVTKAQAAVALSTGHAAEIVGEELARIDAESLAETAVLAHTALVAEVEKDINASFERALAVEKEKMDALERLAQEAKSELEKLRNEREDESNALVKERAAVESEMEILSRLRNDLEEQLANLLSNKMEIAFERDRINKLREDAEKENLAISQLQYELEVERKALNLARSWAEDEAKRARKQAKALEEARERWEKYGIKVIVDEELRESASAVISWQTTEKHATIEETNAEAETMTEKVRSKSLLLMEGLKVRAELLVAELGAMLEKVKGKSAAVIEGLILKIKAVIMVLEQYVLKVKIHSAEAKQQAADLFSEVKDHLVSRSSASIVEFKNNASGFGSSVKDSTRKVAEEFRESIDKITQRFKT